mgnify:CR=1 FL=1
MKLPQNLKTEILKAYHDYWNAYFKGDMQTMSYWMHENIQMVGSGRGEFFKNKKETIGYYKSTADQVAGKADMRNRKISVAMIGDQVMVNEQCDFFVLIDGVWSFYEQGRISTLFTKTNKGWKIIQEHGSMPDARTSEGEQVNTNKIKAENVRLKNAVKRRTIELEEKNRELQIEAALERVRAATMTMKDSSELGQLIFNLYNELTKLDAKLDRCFIMIVNPDTLGITWWLAGKEGLLADNGFLVPNNNYPSHQLYLKHWKKKTKKWQYLLQGKEKKDFDRFGFSKTALANLPEPVKKDMAAVKKTFLFGSSDRFGCLLTGSLEPLAAEHQHIISRFAKVFNQTYTRFLDLQKAEAQAREAKIEGALEKVRSSSLAMHRSDELQGVVNTVIERLKELNIVLDTTNILIFDDKEKRMEFWTGSNSTGTQLSTSWKVPYADFLYYKQIRQARENKQEIFAGNYSFEEKNKIYHYLFTQTDFRHLNPERKKFILKSPRATIVSGIANDIAIQIVSYSRESFTSDEIEIVKRFAKVFNQAYTRFLDLQKAEVQTREAQIQLALERVRAKSLAMHHSSELQEVANITAQQLHGIGMDINGGVFICINAEVDKDLPIWASGGMADYVQKVMVPVFNKPIITAIREAVKKGNSFLIETFTDKEKLELFTHLFKYEPWKNLPSQRKKELLSRKGGFARSVAISRYTSISITNHNGKDFTEDENEILKRFGKVFEQSYIRFLDLQKAEAQTREAQIEAGLERVRANAMAMQSSDELKALIGTVFTELTKLDLALTRCIIWVFEPTTNAARWWMTNSEEPFKPMSFYIKYHKHPAYLRFVQEWKNQNVKFVYDLKGADKRKWDDILFSKTELKNLPTVVIDGMKKPERILLSASFNNFGGINVASLEPLSDEHFDILLRFAKVFDLTYTRFLDLQKAEAQAIEAQIEASLERVRSRTMAMQKSNELKDVIRLVYEQFIHLKIHIEHTGFLIDYKTRDDVLHIWLADEHLAPSEVIFPWFDCPPNNSIRDAKNKGEDFFKYHLTFEEKNKFYRDLFQLIPGVPEETIAYYQNCRGLAGSGVLLESIGLYIENFSGTPYTEEENAVLMRFGKVFQQTYTRFLDLQKAEAQAREAQIEAALEKVRSRTMAMQHSDELNPTADILFEQLKKLGADLQGVAFTICDKNSTIITKWTSIGIFSFPYTIEPAEQNMYEAWKNNVPLYEEVFEGEKLRKYYETLMEVPAFKQGLQKMLDAGFPIPTWQKNHAVSFQQGYLLVITTKPFEETQIFVRFGKVFEQTYTRFLDLQKAETQAREAQIEAALEKVRSKAMSMHVSTELKEVASEMRNQLHLLGQKALETCAIHLYDVTPDYIETWAALRLPDSEDEMVKVEASYPKKGIRILEETIKNYSSKKMDYVLEVDKANEIELFEEIKKRAPAAYKVILESTKGKADDDVWVYWSLSDFPGGSLVMVTHKLPHEDERRLLRRFANVFGLAYQRFSDLQKAETSAREAIKQAALDRIRADIASMRTTEDLERITPVIWTELKILGISFIRCGVFIMDDEKELIHTFLSTPDGKAIAAIHIPYDTPGKIKLIPQNWRKNQKYTDHWNDPDFIDFANALLQQHAIASADQYLSGVPHGGFYLHFVPFLQGMMYVGNTTALREEAINLIQSVADAFATAYARYEDFNKLEAAKKRVDSTLTELQATQKQLIQSEKMASLGELTAGIAHEIQNPLNFVNNFSEVSKELLDEMKDAMDKGETEEAKEIMQDVINNLEKINHHGKRADGIVKGMLQHSRSSSGQKELTDINALCDEYLRLSYHGLRAKDKTFNAKFETDFDRSLPKINVVPQEIGRVILNLINNAFYAVNEKQKAESQMQKAEHYEPTVTVSTKKDNDKVIISIKDNGTGIPSTIKDKIFQPFFTTKPTGSGTGLGLSLSYDIVTKGHGGELKVETTDGGGSEFVILLSL